jgi:eukaryotic-like serine/threonine-protein kinase
MLALQSGACAEAVRYLRRALELSQMTVAPPVRSVARRRGLRRGMLDPNAHVDRDSQSFALGRIHGALSEAYFRLGDLKSSRNHAVHALTQFGQDVPDGKVAWTAATLRQLLLRAVQSLTRANARDPERARLIACEVARVQLRLTDTFFYSLRLAPIIWSSFRVVNQCEPAGPSPELAQGYAILALLASPARMPRLADTWARRALTIAEGTGIERHVAWVVSRICVNYLSECRWTEAAAAVERATAIAERVGDLRLWEEVRTEAAMLAFFNGKFEGSLALFREAHTLSRRSGNRQIACWSLIGEGGSLSRLGRDSEAIDRLEAAFAMIDEDIMKTEALCALGVLALARFRAGDRASASEAADRTLWYIRAMNPVAYWTVHAIAATAEVFLTLREERGVEGGTLDRRVHDAVAAMRRFARRFPVGQPAAFLLRGHAEWISEHHRRAHGLWRRAADRAERLGMPYERARAHLEIGRHLSLGADDRIHHLHQAADLFEKLGCVTDLARTGAELRSPGAVVEAAR